MRIYSYVMTLCANVTLAEEITQETFFRAINAGKNAEFRDGSSEVTWLCAIAKNLYADEMRRKKRSAELPPDTESGEDVEQTVSDSDASYRVHVILHSLDEPYKEVFQLRVFGELPFRKIGELFGKSENWARVTYHRASLKIKERLNE